MSKKSSPATQALDTALVRRIDRIVAAYARADGNFVTGVMAIAADAGAVTEGQWAGVWQPVFRDAFERHSVGSGYVLLGRVKSLFLCAANGVLPVNDAGVAVTGLHTAADATRREALAKAKVLAPVGTGKGANKGKGKGADRRSIEKPEAANDTGNLLDLASIKPEKAYTQADMRGAGIILTGSPKLATELAALLVADKDAPSDLRKLLRTFIDGRKA